MAKALPKVSRKASKQISAATKAGILMRNQQARLKLLALAIAKVSRAIENGKDPDDIRIATVPDGAVSEAISVFSSGGVQRAIQEAKKNRDADARKRYEDVADLLADISETATCGVTRYCRKGGTFVSSAFDPYRANSIKMPDGSTGWLGSSTNVLYETASGTGSLHARYALLPFAAVKPSNDPLKRFAPTPGYPKELQERDYEGDQVEQQKVLRAADPKQFHPELLISDNEDALTGPPIIDQSGFVVGGNGRTMIAQLNAAKYGPEAYGNELAKELSCSACYGLHRVPNQGLLLVRVLEGDFDRKRISRILNAPVTAVISREAGAVSLGDRLSDKVLDRLSDALETVDTFPAAVRKLGSWLPQQLLKEGIITPLTRTEWLQTDRGQVIFALNRSAIDRLSDALIGSLLKDVSALRETPRALWRFYEYVAPKLMLIDRFDPENRSGYNFVPQLRASARELSNGVPLSSVKLYERYGQHPMIVCAEDETVPDEQCDLDLESILYGPPERAALFVWMRQVPKDARTPRYLSPAKTAKAIAAYWRAIPSEVKSPGKQLFGRTPEELTAEGLDPDAIKKRVLGLATDREVEAAGGPLAFIQRQMVAEDPKLGRMLEMMRKAKPKPKPAPKPAPVIVTPDPTPPTPRPAPPKPAPVLVAPEPTPPTPKKEKPSFRTDIGKPFGVYWSNLAEWVEAWESSVKGIKGRGAQKRKWQHFIKLSNHPELVEGASPEIATRALAAFNVAFSWPGFRDDTDVANPAREIVVRLKLRQEAEPSEDVPIAEVEPEAGTAEYADKMTERLAALLESREGAFADWFEAERGVRPNIDVKLHRNPEIPGSALVKLVAKYPGMPDFYDQVSTSWSLRSGREGFSGYVTVFSDGDPKAAVRFDRWPLDDFESPEAVFYEVLEKYREKTKPKPVDEETEIDFEDTEEEEPDLTIHHSAERGTVIDGDTRPYKDAIKALGMRWSRRAQLWYKVKSRGMPTARINVYEAKRKLEDAGATVAIDVEEATDEEAAAAKADHLHERAAVASERAEKAREAAQAAYERSGSIVGQIPLGQPILVGHHSEKRHRRDIERSHRAMDKIVEEQRKAELLQSRAENLEAEARKFEALAETTPSDRKARVQEIGQQISKNLKRDLLASSVRQSSRSGPTAKNPWVMYDVYIPTARSKRGELTGTQIHFNRVSITQRLAPVASFKVPEDKTAEEIYARLLRLFRALRDAIWEKNGTPAFTPKQQKNIDGELIERAIELRELASYWTSFGVEVPEGFKAEQLRSLVDHVHGLVNIVQTRKPRNMVVSSRKELQRTVKVLSAAVNAAKKQGIDIEGPTEPETPPSLPPVELDEPIASDFDIDLAEERIKKLKDRYFDETGCDASRERWMARILMQMILAARSGDLPPILSKLTHPGRIKEILENAENPCSTRGLECSIWEPIGLGTQEAWDSARDELYIIARRMNLAGLRENPYPGDEIIRYISDVASRRIGPSDGSSDWSFGLREDRALSVLKWAQEAGGTWFFKPRCSFVVEADRVVDLDWNFSDFDVKLRPVGASLKLEPEVAPEAPPAALPVIAREPLSVQQYSVYDEGAVPKWGKTPALDVNVWGRYMPPATSYYIDKHNVVAILRQKGQGWCIYVANPPDEREPEPAPKFCGCFTKLAVAKLAVAAALAGNVPNGQLMKLVDALSITRADVDTRIRYLCDALLWTFTGKCADWARSIPKSYFDEIKTAARGNLESQQGRLRAMVSARKADQLLDRARELRLRVVDGKIHFPEAVGYIEIKNEGDPGRRIVEWFSQDESTAKEAKPGRYRRRTGVGEFEHAVSASDQVLSILQVERGSLSAPEIHEKIKEKAEAGDEFFSALEYESVTDGLQQLGDLVVQYGGRWTAAEFVDTATFDDWAGYPTPESGNGHWLAKHERFPGRFQLLSKHEALRLLATSGMEDPRSHGFESLFWVPDPDVFGVEHTPEKAVSHIETGNIKPVWDLRGRIRGGVRWTPREHA